MELLRQMKISHGQEVISTIFTRSSLEAYWNNHVLNGTQALERKKLNRIWKSTESGSKNNEGVE